MDLDIKQDDGNQKSQAIEQLEASVRKLTAQTMGKDEVIERLTRQVAKQQETLKKEAS